MDNLFLSRFPRKRYPYYSENTRKIQAFCPKIQKGGRIFLGEKAVDRRGKAAVLSGREGKEKRRNIFFSAANGKKREKKRVIPIIFGDGEKSFPYFPRTG